jgi:DNA-binding NarL/FixJ family response regulator
VAANLEGCAILAAAEGRPERAQMLVALAAAIGETTGTVLALDEQRRVEARLQPIRRALGEATCAQILEQARRMTIGEAIGYALNDDSQAPRGDALPTEGDGTGRLSSRQVEIARLVARGLTDRQVAETLVISSRTAEWHVAKILEKLELDTRAQLGVWAARHGLAPDPES